MPNLTTEAIRNRYAEVGVSGYYESEGASYANPHFPELRQLLLRNAYRIDYNRALDFCCGSGEVSKVIQEMGYPLPAASDPYTAEAYGRNFGGECMSLSFADVIRGQLNGIFSAVICSFALHLCPQKQLYPLVHQLLAHSDQLVIITPHKRPDLSPIAGIELQFEDTFPTQRGKNVFLKCYRLSRVEGNLKCKI